MQQILVYGDSLTWGIVPGTRQRLEFHRRWPGVMENALLKSSLSVRVIEDCLNGRRTVWDDPFKPGRNGLEGLAQRIEINSPLALVMVVLGTNDFQSTHACVAWQSAQGLATVVRAIRGAPIEPTMPIPDILLVAPPPMVEPKGVMASKFANASTRSAGLAKEIQQVATDLGCHFCDIGSVTGASTVDGVHLDADQHATVGQYLADVVRPLL